VPDEPTDVPDSVALIGWHIAASKSNTHQRPSWSHGEAVCVRGIEQRAGHDRDRLLPELLPNSAKPDRTRQETALEMTSFYSHNRTKPDAI